MKKLNKENYIRFRVSNADKANYQKVSNSLGLSISGFVRWSANTQIRLHEKELYEREN